MENAVPVRPVRPANRSRVKFLIGGLLILAAIVYLIASSTQASAQYFLTISELKSRGTGGREARISGAVIGDTIHYDSKT